MKLEVYVALAIACTSSVWGVFASLHLIVRSEFSASFGARLVAIDPSEWARTWSREWTRLFERVFSNRHLSGRCIASSAVASLVWVAFAFIFALIVTSTSPSVYFATFTGMRVDAILWGVGYLLIGNLLPDYLSLLETRWIVHRIDLSKWRVRTVPYLALDLVLTATIYCAFYTLYLWISDYAGDLAPLSLLELYRALEQAFTQAYGWTFHPHLDPAGYRTFEYAIPYYSTFGTSVWVCLYALAGYTLKSLDTFGSRPWRFLTDNVFNVERSPVLVFGWLLGGITLFGFIAAAAFAVE